MIQILTVYNPCTNEYINWSIEIRNLEYSDWERNLIELKANSDKMAFNYYLNSLNPQIYKDKLYFDTNSFAYQDILSKYFRRLYIIDDYIKYNYWLDKLLKRIEENLTFEYEFKTKVIMKEGPVKKETHSEIKTKSIPNKWVKLETTSLFEGKVVYIYENLKTHETIESENPNMLEELNARKRSTNASTAVAFTFNFNKKK